MPRRRRLPSFNEYIVDSCDRLHELGGSPELETIDKLDVVILRAEVSFPWDDVELSVFEVLRPTEGDHAHRDRYRYQCLLMGGLVFRYDRDPRIHPEMPEHKHLPDGSRISIKTSQVDMLKGLWIEVEIERRRRELVSARSA